MHVLFYVLIDTFPPFKSKIFPISVCVYWTAAEICQNASECVGTVCKNANHTHIECVDRHCTCSSDPVGKWLKYL